MFTSGRAGLTRDLCNRALHYLPIPKDFVSSPACLTVEKVMERYHGQVSEGALANCHLLRLGPLYIKTGKAPFLTAGELDRWARSNLVLCRQSKRSKLAAGSAENAVAHALRAANRFCVHESDWRKARSRICSTSTA